MEDDEKKLERNRERRRQRALQRLGREYPVCVHCQEDDPFCLERHHVAGRKHGDEIAIVCRNCHRKLSDRQKDHPHMIGKTPAPLEGVAHFLLGVADFLELVIKRLRDFAHELIAHVRDSRACATCGV